MFILWDKNYVLDTPLEVLDDPDRVQGGEVLRHLQGDRPGLGRSRRQGRRHRHQAGGRRGEEGRREALRLASDLAAGGPSRCFSYQTWFLAF